MPRTSAAMASKRALLNAKRSLRRRNLAERLELARRDADTVHSEEEAPAPWQTGTAKAGGSSSARAPEAKAQPKVQPRAKKEIKSETKNEVKDEPKSEDESLPGALARGKPSRAAHLAPLGARDEPGRTDSDEDVHSSLDARDFMAEDVRSSSREPSRSASAWMEEGRIQKEQGYGGRGRGAVRLRPRRSVEPEQHRGQPSGQQAPPPWRQEDELRGIKRVLPRWEVELGLKRAQPLDLSNFPAAELSEEDKNLSKVSTQLLRWGRADVESEGGGRRTLWLQNWAPDAWYSLDDIARSMHVPRDKLPIAVLCSEGSRGPRVIAREQHGRVVFKARWTSEERRGRGQRGGQHGGRREQGDDSRRDQRDGRRRGRDGR